MYGLHKNLRTGKRQLTNAEAYRNWNRGLSKRPPSCSKTWVHLSIASKQSGWRLVYNGQQIVDLTIQRQRGLISASSTDPHLLPASATGAGSVNLDCFRSLESIRQSVNDVEFSLAMAISLVVWLFSSRTRRRLSPLPCTYRVYLRGDVPAGFAWTTVADGATLSVGLC